MNIQNKHVPMESAPVDPPDFAPQNETGFDFRILLRVIRTRLRIIVGTAVAVVALTGLIVFRITPIYTAASLVMLDQRSNKVLDVNAVLAGLPTDQTSIENQVQILRSRGLISRVIDKLHLDQDRDFVPPPGARRASSVFDDVLSALNPAVWVAGVKSFFSPSVPVVLITEEEKADAARNGIIDRLLGQITVSAQGRSTAIQIRVASASPSQAASIANAVADSYVEDQLNSKVEATQATTKWLADRLQETSGQAQAAEAAVAQYKAQHNLTETGSGPGASTVVQQQLSQINGQLVVARTELAQQEAQYANLIELKNSGRAASAPGVVASPAVAQLRDQDSALQAQVVELTNKYGPRHPRILEIESQKRSLESKIASEVQRVIDTVSNEVVVARARVRALQESLAGLSRATTGESQTRVKLSELESVATSSRSLYETFLSKFKETQGQTDIETPDARVISRAQVPNVATSPNKTRDMELAVAGGLFLGFLLAMLLERLDGGFRTGIQAERLLGLPALATLPELRKLGPKEVSAADRVVTKPLSAYSEGVRGLQMGLVLSNVDETPKVVVVTSSIPGEGKTTVAISLARLAASNGKRVALIDCDLRRPGVAKMIGQKGLKAGLVHVLAGKTKLEECLFKDPLSDVIILPAVGKIPNPPDLLGSAAMEHFIKHLRDNYDLVVVDSAPLLPVNDTKILAKLADTVLFVVRWEKTPREAVTAALRELAAVAASVAGVVLARADDRRQKYYSYGYASYYSYRKYYAD